MKIYYACIFLFISSFSVSFASTIVDSDITSSSVWNASGSPYIITGIITVAEDAVLTISPGTTIKFDGGEIIVRGTLNAEGTHEEKISFTSFLNDTIGGDSNNDQDESLPSQYDYGGITFVDAQGESSFSYTTFSYSISPLQLISSHLSLDSVEITSTAQGIIGNNSTLTSDNLIMDTIDDDAIQFFNNSTVTLTYTDIKNSLGDALAVFSSSTLSFDEGTIEHIDGSALTLFDSSNGVISDLHIVNANDRIGDTVTVYNNSDLTLSDSTIQQSGDDAALLVYSNGKMSLENVELNEGTGNGIQIFSNGELTIASSTISNYEQNGILGFNGGIASITQSTLQNNTIGIQLYTPLTVTINNSRILDNDQFGILNNSTETIDARNNWWGSPESPEEYVSGLVDTEPWLLTDPVATVSECCSSILFIPGMQASRLYKKGLLFENQLWEPNRKADVEKLYLNEQGTSIDPSLYTRDIIERTNLPAFNQNIYHKLSTLMNSLVEQEKIADWEPFPYDWRLDIPYIISNGSLQQDGSYKKIDTLIEQLASTSQSGKVTIIAHSNGGLLAKALINALQASNKASLIDSVILVASPQLGTPQAISALLHGHNQALLGGIILNEQIARSLAVNAPGVYNLLPSEKYIEKEYAPLVTFDPSLSSFSNLYDTYGPTITSYQELEDFLKATQDHRTYSTSNHSLFPLVANSLLVDKAKAVHTSLDSWTAPTGINVYQIAGTGLDTVSGISYSEKWWRPDFFDYSPMMSTKGDGTVMGVSATSMDASNYFINLQEYNKDTSQNISHATILESDPVLNLISATIQGEDYENEEYISSSDSAKKSQTKISIHSPVSIDLYDAEGRHTGLVPTTGDSDIEISEAEIPNSYYLPFGEGVYTGVDSSTPVSIELNGTGIGTFTVVLESATSTIVFQDIPVLPTSHVSLSSQVASSSVLNIDFDGDGTIDSTVAPSTDPDPLLYLQSLKKLITSLDIPAQQKQNLIKKIDKIITKIKNGKLKKAEQLIKKYLKALNHKKKFKKHLTPEERQEILAILTNLFTHLDK